MAGSFFGKDFEAEIIMEREASAAALRQAEYPPERVERMIEEASRKAREEGYAEGRLEGSKEASGDISAKLVGLTSEMLPVLKSLLEGQAAHNRAVENDMTSFVISVIEKAVPQILRGYNDDRAEAEVRSICRRAQGSRWLEVRTSPGMRGKVESLLLEGMSGIGEEKALKVEADEGLSDHEISALWNGGSSDHSHERLCKEIMTILKADIAKRSKERKGQK